VKAPDLTEANGDGSNPRFERLGDSLYWKGGTIMARVRVNGKRTWRGTGTDNPAEARKWLKKWKSEEWMEHHGIEAKGIVLHRKRVTVGELIAAYVEAGFPTRKMRAKRPATIRCEKACLCPLRAFFGQSQAAALTVADCDRYRDWRLAGGFIACVSPADAEKRKRSSRMKQGTRSVDLELTILTNVLNLATRRQVLRSNPLHGKARYSTAEQVRHCREVAPTPAGLKLIENWLRGREDHAVADFVCFLAYTGLRIGEALPLDWEAVNWGERLLHVVREKRGITPWVPVLPELEALLRAMQKRSTSHLLFPSPFDAEKPRDASAAAHRIGKACKELGLGHVTPHGLRSYFVTQARQSGLSDAEIAMLIGDKSGPAIIAQTYGDVRPEHLMQQAQRIRLTVHEGQQAGQGVRGASSAKSSPGVQNVSAGVSPSPVAS
jgi:integrase